MDSDAAHRTSRILIVTALAAAAALGGCSCSGDDGPGSSPDGGVSTMDGSGGGDGSTDDAASGDGAPSDAGSVDASTAEAIRDLCMQLVALQCEAMERCCTEQQPPLYPTRDECLMRQGMLCRILSEGEAAASGLIVVPGSPETIVADAMEAAAACAAFDWGEKSFTRGTLPEGADCTPQSLVFRFGPEPSDASMLFACGPELHCELTGTDMEFTGTCRPLSNVGGYCHIRGCVDTAYCDTSMDLEGHPAIGGVCVMRGDVGAACDGDPWPDCLSFNCVDGMCAEPPPLPFDYCQPPGAAM